MRTTRTARLTSGLLALALALTACGDSDNDDTTTTGASGEGPAGSPVKIMLIAPTGTQEANYPESVAAAKAGVTAVNQRNGFAGHKVELLYCNEKNEPAAAEACGRQAVEEGVIAVVGMFSRIGGILPQLEKANIPSVAGLGVAKDEITSKNSFFTSASLLTFAVCPNILADEGAKSLGMTRFDVEASAVTETFANAGAVAATGKPLAKVVTVSPTNADYAPVATQHVGAGIDAVTMSLTEQASAAFMQAGGNKFKYCHTEAGLSNENLQGMPQAAPNFYAGTSFYTLHETDKPAIKQFTEELDAAVSSDPDAKLRKGNQLFPWGGIQILEKILEGESGDITGETVITKLKEQTALDTGFTVAPLDFSKDGPIPGLGRIVNLTQQGLKYDKEQGFMVPTGKTYNVGEILAKAGGEK